MMKNKSGLMSRLLGFSAGALLVSAGSLYADASQINTQLAQNTTQQNANLKVAALGDPTSTGLTITTSKPGPVSSAFSAAAYAAQSFIPQTEEEDTGSTYAEIALKYKINSAMSSKLIISGSAAESEDNESKANDTIVQFDFPSFLKIDPLGIKFTGRARAYVPTSEESQDAGLQGVGYARVKISKAMGPVDAGFGGLTRKYFYDAENAEDGTPNNNYRLTGLLFATVTILSNFSYYGEIDYKQDNDNSGEQTYSFYNVHELNVDLNDKLSAQLGLENAGSELRANEGTENPYMVYVPEKTSMYLSALYTIL